MRGRRNARWTVCSGDMLASVFMGGSYSTEMSKASYGFVNLFHHGFWILYGEDIILDSM